MTEQKVLDVLAAIEQMQRTLRIAKFWTRVSIAWLMLMPIINGAIVVWVLYR